MYFTYLFEWSNANKKYYGVRYKDNATPDSLCKSYFSSSKYVKKFIEEYGLPDVVEVRRMFSSKLDAKRWEEKVIRRLKATKRDDWINRGNNNSFKDVVCDERVRSSISEARKGQSHGILYNNGTTNQFFKSGEAIPDGWNKGRIQSEKQKQHIKRLNEQVLTDEKRKLAGIKNSLKTSGVKKPPQHGANVSKATKGKPKPWQQGDNNVSKRDDVRHKISESWKTRVIGLWYTNNGKNLYVKPGDNIPEGYVRGKASKAKQKV